MARTIVVALDQLARPQPGGVATYVCGLLGGLAEVAPDDRLVGLVPRGGVSIPPARPRPVPLDVRVLTRLWARWPIGVPRDADVVHGPSLAGPFGGGRRGAVHSVAVHDLLWRDAPEATTRNGAAFHEARLARLRRAEDVRAVLAAHGVTGPFTFYAGTREPRKNLERLVAGHAAARRDVPELGPLVIAGPAGWGDVDLGDAVVVGQVERAVLLGLYRASAVVAYVPLAEGWGLPPVEALARGTRVVASSTTPSVEANPTVIRVDPRDVTSIAAGLVAALRDDDDDPVARDRRRASVGDLSWRQCALDHLVAWR